MRNFCVSTFTSSESAAVATTAIVNGVVVGGDSPPVTGTLVMAGDRIVAVGPDAVVPAGSQVVDADGAIVLPGLVNAHCHQAMTLFRGLADDRDLAGFLGHLVPLESSWLTPARVELGTRLAVVEAVSAGITRTMDMYFWPESIRAAARAVGLPERWFCSVGPALFNGRGVEGMDFDEQLVAAGEWLAAGEGDPSSLWLQPHSTYLLSPTQLSQAASLAESFGARVHVHAAETEKEVADVVAETGRRPIQVLADAALLTDRTVLAHAVWVTPDEIELIAECGAHVVHCPASNLKLASGFSPVAQMLAAGVNVALGTDGPASSNDLDLFGAMRLAALVAKGWGRDATALAATDVLRMATVGGAAALGAADEGTIAVGAAANVVLMRSDSPGLHPRHDPLSTLVYSASRADVRAVWVGGRQVVDGGRFVATDVDALLAEVRAEADDLT